MDLQVDLRRTLEAEPEADREPDQGQDVEPSAVDDTPPLVYPQESPLSTADVDIDGLPALPEKLYASVGSFMGAMQSLATGWMFPKRIEKVISITVKYLSRRIVIFLLSFQLDINGEIIPSFCSCAVFCGGL